MPNPPNEEHVRRFKATVDNLIDGQEVPEEDTKHALRVAAALVAAGVETFGADRIRLAVLVLGGMHEMELFIKLAEMAKEKVDSQSPVDSDEDDLDDDLDELPTSEEPGLPDDTSSAAAPPPPPPPPEAPPDDVMNSDDKAPGVGRREVKARRRA